MIPRRSCSAVEINRRKSCITHGGMPSQFYVADQASALALLAAFGPAGRIDVKQAFAHTPVKKSRQRALHAIDGRAGELFGERRQGCGHVAASHADERLCV